MQISLKSETSYQVPMTLDKTVDSHVIEFPLQPVSLVLMAVEDDQLRKKLESQTLALGYSTSSLIIPEFNTIQVCFSEFQKQIIAQPDLILLALPKAEIYCHLLRSSPKFKNTSIVVLTDEFDDDSINHILDAGATDCISVNLPQRLFQKRLLPYLNSNQYIRKLQVVNTQLQTQVYAQNETLREALKQVRRAIAKEIEINHARFNSLKNISHELRTSLSIISLSAQLLQGKVAKNDETLQLDLSRQISQSVKAIARIIDNLVSVQKATTNTLEFHPVATPLTSFCQTLVNQWQQDAGTQYKINFNNYGEATSFAEVDPILLRQILDELAINAMRFSPIRSQIWLHLIWQPDRVLLQVIDEGVGISDLEQKQVFEPFYRGKNADEIAGTPGVGLGLAIAQYATQLHQGTITLDSQLNQGTTVTVSLPLSQTSSSYAAVRS